MPEAAPITPASICTEPVTLLKALADPVRYAALKELAGGDALSVITLATRLKCHPDTMGKHLKVLWRAKAIVRANPEDADGRLQYYQVPSGCRHTESNGKTTVDYGVCAVRFG